MTNDDVLPVTVCETFILSSWKMEVRFETCKKCAKGARGEVIMNVYSLKVFLAKIIFFLCFFLNSKVKNMCILFVLTIMRISVYLYWEHEESGSLRITV